MKIFMFKIAFFFFTRRDRRYIYIDMDGFGLFPIRSISKKASKPKVGELFDVILKLLMYVL